MKALVPVALGVVVVFVFTFFYFLTIKGTGKMSSFGFVNSVGLVAVAIGIIAAGVILRRSTPHP